MKGILNFFRVLGPGLLFAGAAIGVSHLVQSTRAGATFGFGLIWAVLLANIMKYPFFEFGPRYAAATGESLLHGYKRLGTWVLVLFLIITLLTVFTIQSAVTIVTAGIAQHIFSLGSYGILLWSIVLLSICFLILMIGHYALLDGAMKLIIIILSISTVVAVLSAIGINKPPVQSELKQFNWRSAIDIAFLIGLMGWMPAPIDLSVWHSLWAVEKRKLNPEISWRQSSLDFNIGYSGAIVLAICFLSLGALVLYGSGEVLSEKGSVFANQLIQMYTQSIGKSAKWIITIAAFTTMFSTTLTCFDAIPRVLGRTMLLFKSNQIDGKIESRLYWILLVILFIGAILIISIFSQQMISLVQLATILSFLTAPFFAFANYKLVTNEAFPESMRPNRLLRIISFLGIIYLFAFIAIYLLFSYFEPFKEWLNSI